MSLPPDSISTYLIIARNGTAASRGAGILDRVRSRHGEHTQWGQSAGTGRLPLAFGLTILTNDLIWWPAFGLFLRDAARLSGGWLNLLRGE